MDAGMENCRERELQGVYEPVDAGMENCRVGDLQGVVSLWMQEWGFAGTGNYRGL